jgi:hypothetical protein
MELAQLSPRRLAARLTEGIDGTLLTLSLLLAALGWRRCSRRATKIRGA